MLCFAVFCFAQDNRVVFAEEHLMNENFTGAFLLYEDLLHLIGNMTAFEAERVIYGYASAAHGTGKLVLTKELFSMYLRNFPKGRFADEIKYKQARLILEEGVSIEALSGLVHFTQENLSSPYLPNALFWIGETLFSLGYPEDAAAIFQRIYTEFPNSYYVQEAKRRRNDVFRITQENQLRTLLSGALKSLMNQADTIKTLETKYLLLLQQIEEGSQDTKSTVLQDLKTILMMIQDISTELEEVIKKM